MRRAQYNSSALQDQLGSARCGARPLAGLRRDGGPRCRAGTVPVRIGSATLWVAFALATQRVALPASKTITARLAVRGGFVPHCALRRSASLAACAPTIRPCLAARDLRMR